MIILATFIFNIILIIPFCAGLAAAAARYGSRSLDCKAVPGTAGWPSKDSWASLSRSTGGWLLQPAPPGAVCHPGQPTYNATQCPAVQSGWSTFEFHQADPISTYWNQWNNDSCLPEEGLPCSGQGYPVYVINATTADHVRLGVNYARRHNIRLVVKSSGHDFLGRSGAPNALSIWTHHIKGLQVYDSFSPRHCNVKIPGTAITVGSGMQMEELYSALDALNQTIVGGGGRTVSVGGYLTGGGHSLLSARYGLGTDQVLEMEVVTPSGEIVTANECQNTDLFWAMRGGGGSTFGVLTSITVKTYPTPQIVNLILALATTDIQSPSVFDMVAYILSQFPHLGDQGLSGYAFIFSATPNPYDGGATTVAGIFMAMVLQDSTVEAMTELWAPILAHVNTTWPGQFQLIFQTKTYPSFYGWFKENYDTSAAGVDKIGGSRLLDADALTRNLTLSAEVFKQFSEGSVGNVYLVAGKGVHDAVPRGGSNSVCPAWRSAYVHANYWADFAPLNATAKAEAFDRVNYHLEPLRKTLAPDSGAYMNEADPQEPDWQHQFWGTNYARLLRIKRVVDPDDVLWCTPCVGNERWHQTDDGRLCKVAAWPSLA
ncbi:hypothetical protein B0T19DRAFT_38823 [Cercophora scortea]|uniref:FAD-binding PCMH-type domain-containing protein n=1 Tax=Cercophora scortea TaxID=314031 RepID=A0AAE0J4M2_9PEZI|nr:hypothetical protein B0T19DRAFT_38823 [Cercophora scortea]